MASEVAEGAVGCAKRHLVSRCKGGTSGDGMKAAGRWNIGRPDAGGWPAEVGDAANAQTGDVTHSVTVAKKGAHDAIATIAGTTAAVGAGLALLGRAAFARIATIRTGGRSAKTLGKSHAATDCG